MVDRGTRVALWGDSGYMLSAQGEDASSTVVMVSPGGEVVASATVPGELREIAYLQSESGLVSRFTLDVDTKVRLLRSELGIWDRDGTSTVRYSDGVEAELRRRVDYDWHRWESVTSPAHRTPKGWVTGNNKWTTIWHPWEKVAGGGRTRESFTYGSEDYQGHRSSYSSTQVVERDASGREVRRTSVSGGYDHSSGSHERGVSIRYSNGDWVKQVHRTEKDGSWTDSTTTKQGGHYVTRTSTGHGSTTDTYKQSESDEDPTDDGEDPEPDPPDDDAPTGDGTDAGSEGNPDGPLSGVDIRDLIGDDWRGPEELDTLGDLDGLMRPWMDRIWAARAAGGSGTPSTGEVLDTLGAPPVIVVDLGHYEPDDLADHDPLGRPPPILSGWFELAEGVSLKQAPSIPDLLTAAESFALTAEAAAKSIQILRFR